MKKIIPAFFIVISVLIASLTLQAQAQQINYTLEKVTMATNPAGLGFGFWNNGKFSAKSMLDFGRRPYERNGFYSWSAIETSPGVYDTAKIIKDIKQIHSLGSTCIIALNNAASPDFNPTSKGWIPKFYKEDIDNPKTREAARKYVYAVIKDILQQTGDLWVSFDYELIFNFKPDTPQKQKKFSTWYIEEVAIARQAAADLNMSDKLKIMPIVNGSVNSDGMAKILNSGYKNHKPAEWLTKMMAVSDFLAIDCYYIDLDDPSNIKTTMASFAFWTKNYSLGKPVIVTEVGFSTGVTQFPNYKFPGKKDADGKRIDKAMGTEQQQHDFYTNLLPALARENVPGGMLNGQLRGVMFWMYSDSDAKKHGEERQHYFGFVRMDGSRKPSFEVVRSGINAIESNPASAPSLEKARAKVDAVALNQGVASRFISGTAYDCFLVTTDKQAGKATLEVTLGDKGAVLVYSAGKWYQSLGEKTTHTLQVSLDGAPARIYLTGGKFPFEQTLKNITIKSL